MNVNSTGNKRKKKTYGQQGKRKSPSANNPISRGPRIKRLFDKLKEK